MEERKTVKKMQLLENTADNEQVVMYDAKELSEIFGVNVNRSTDFLKKFGVKIGHWQIEQGKLLEILKANAGVLI